MKQNMLDTIERSFRLNAENRSVVLGLAIKEYDFAIGFQTPLYARKAGLDAASLFFYWREIKDGFRRTRKREYDMRLVFQKLIPLLESGEVKFKNISKADREKIISYHASYNSASNHASHDEEVWDHEVSFEGDEYLVYFVLKQGIHLNSIGMESPSDDDDSDDVSDWEDQDDDE